MRGIWAGGGSFHVSDPLYKKSVVERGAESRFRSLLGEILKRDMPFFGVYYGLGILTTSIGANVSKNAFAEAAGPTDIFVTDEGNCNPLLSGLHSPFRAFTGHKEACETTPLGATLLATSPLCPVQMICVGTNVYASQFHPELNPDSIRIRIDAYRHHGYFAPDEAEELKARCARETITVPPEILWRFVSRICRLRYEFECDMPHMKDE